MNYLMLVFITAIWGLGFIATKWTLVDYSAIWSNSIRFILAGLIAFPFLIYFKSYKLSFKKLASVSLASIALLFAMLLQTWGLVYTSAAKSGFITCLYTLFIPLLIMIIYKKKYSIYFWGLLFQSLIGVSLLCNLDITQFNFGDLLTLFCAVGFAIHFLIIDKIAKDFPSAVELNSLQCFIVGFISLPMAYLVEGSPNLTPLLNIGSIAEPSPLLGFLCLSIFSSFVAFAILCHAQKFIAAHTVGMICLLESPFAALFGYLFLEEKLSPSNIAGCILVMTSVALIPLADGNRIKNFKLRLKKRMRLKKI